MSFRRMFQRSASPVVADFGASSVKLLQLAGGEDPSIIAAQLLEIPDEACLNEEVTLKFIEGLGNDDVSAIMDRSPGAIRVLQFRALSALRGLLAGREVRYGT